MLIIFAILFQMTPCGILPSVCPSTCQVSTRVRSPRPPWIPPSPGLTAPATSAAMRRGPQEPARRTWSSRWLALTLPCQFWMDLSRTPAPRLQVTPCLTASPSLPALCRFRKSPSHQHGHSSWTLQYLLCSLTEALLQMTTTRALSSCPFFHQGNSQVYRFISWTPSLTPSFPWCPPLCLPPSSTVSAAASSPMTTTPMLQATAPLSSSTWVASHLPGHPWSRGQPALPSNAHINASLPTVHKTSASSRWRDFSENDSHELLYWLTNTYDVNLLITLCWHFRSQTGVIVNVTYCSILV